MDNYTFISNKPSIIRLDQNMMEEIINPNIYNHKYLDSEIKMKNSGYRVVPLSQVSAKIVDGPFGSQLKVEDYSEEGHPLFRVKNIMNGLIQEEDMVFIDSNKQLELKRSQVNKGDVLITKAGRIGSAAVNKYPTGNITSHLCLIRTKEDLYPLYLVAFLESKYGKLNAERWSHKSTRPELTKTEVESIKVLLPPMDIQVYIGDKISKAEQLREEAKLLKEKAKLVIENEVLKINNEKLKTIEKMSSFIQQSYLSPLRLDAEFYSEKFIKVEEIIKELNFQPLENLVEEIQDGPGGWAISTDDYVLDGVPIVRGVNISEDGEFINDGYVYITEQKNEELKKTQVTPGQVLLSVRGTVGKSTVLPSYIKKANLNAAVVRIKLKDNSVDPYYLAGFFNSIVGRLQTSRIANGAVQQNMNLTECKSNLIPIPDRAIQQKYRELFLRSTFLSEQSNALIVEAKQDIESLVEGTFNESKVIEKD